MNVLTLGGDELTRVALRTKVRRIVKEDRQLYFEGVAGLTRNELVQCCEEPRHGVRRAAEERGGGQDERLAAAGGAEARADEVGVRPAAEA